MQYLAIFLIAYGAFMLLALLLKFPFLFNNMKSKAMIKWMGKTTFQIIVLIVSIILITLGIFLLP